MKKRSNEPNITFKNISPKEDFNDNNEEEEGDNDKNKYEEILNIIAHLKDSRAVDYDEWLNILFAIIGACKKSNISRTKCYELIHKFSSKASTKYDENQIDKWIDDNYKKQMERTDRQYGYNYLINKCLKEDDREFYDEAYGRTYKVIKAKLEHNIIKIDNQILYIELYHDRDLFTPESFRTLTKAELIHKFDDMKGFKYIEIVKNKKGEQSKVETNIVELNSKWWKDESKRKCTKLVFKPCKLTEELNKKYFNMFQGFRAEHLPVCKDFTKIERILFHLKNVICNKDEYTYNWFLKYLRAILKGEQTKVMIMIKGLEGCGKNIFHFFS